MAYTKIPVAPGDVISSAWGNHIQTQYEEAAQDMIGMAKKHEQNEFTELQIFQGTKLIHYSISNPYQGLTEIGRFIMTESHDQVRIRGALQSQTGDGMYPIDFDILFRTTSGAEVESVNIYRERIANGSNSGDVKVYSRSVPEGTEFVLCVETSGNQFAAYEMIMASRRVGGYEFIQANMQEEFNTSGYTEQGTYTSRKIFLHDVDMDGSRIMNVAEPTNSDDAANKSYVETYVLEKLNEFGLGVQSWPSPQNINVNNLTTSGLYLADSGSQNLPGSGAYFIWVTGERANSVIQEAVRYETADTIEKYIRRMRQGTWYPWERVWNSGNLPNPATTTQLNNHINNTNNPHNVTSQQINYITPMGAEIDGSAYPVGVTTFESTGNNYPLGQMAILNINPNHSYRLAQLAVENGTSGSAIVHVRTWRTDSGWGDFNEIWGNSNNPFSTGITGYQRFASGLIIQRVRLTNVDANTQVTATFPISFPNTIAGFQISIEADVGVATYTPGTAWCVNRSTSNMRVMHNFESTGQVNLYIEAYGY